MSPRESEPLTREALERFAHTPDARLKQVMQSLVRHLHDFARDVQLTEAEWVQAIGFLTETGQTCTPSRQEFILLSDVLGLSMQTVVLNQARPAGCTESTVLGPFHVREAPLYENGADIANGAAGRPCTVRGQVRSVDGRPLAGALLDVWQADADGEYDVQKPGLAQAQARGKLHADADGRFEFRTIVAESYPIPTDGPVGRLLAATRRSSWRPAHLHFWIEAEGHETLVTHVFRRGDPHIATDPVFGVRQSLMADWREQPDGTTLLEYDFVLNPTVPNPPLREEPA
ncbi:dioxygenase [Aquabacterium sp. J223]|uniref:dioxygenase family protein n=1 Tax=Aquabacterium sp. J223 TaxID=2898431 RepID=UPI0021ADC632|nr:dioxygenase [Aquabacterium sp. J223]UUX94355.1 hydroxyquinol 1,2-dioxygenase [Aquabacterium sp. J223]